MQTLILCFEFDPQASLFSSKRVILVVTFVTGLHVGDLLLYTSFVGRNDSDFVAVLGFHLGDHLNELQCLPPALENFDILMAIIWLRVARD